MALKAIYVDFDFTRNQIIQARVHNVAAPPTGPGEGQVYFNTADKTFRGWNGTTWVDLSQVITPSTAVKGEIANANTNPPFPTSPAIGDYYFITTTAGNIGGVPGTAGSIPVEIGDQLYYSASGFFVVQRNLQAASATLAGFMRFATQAEANAGSEAFASMTPATTATLLAALFYTRKYRTLIVSLAANTATTVTHGLNLANMEDCVVEVYQGGARIELAVAPTTVNALTVTSNQALGNVTVVVIG